MKTYQLVEDAEGETLKRIETDGKVWWIPLDPANSDYAEYLRYTAWVEAGNTPEDFWNQDEELEIIEETQVTEEKEEETTEGES